MSGEPASCCQLSKSTYSDAVCETDRKNDVAIPYDLFAAFDKALGSDSSLPKGLTMAVALEAWTQEEGYPVVTLRTDNGKTTVSQVRPRTPPTTCSQARGGARQRLGEDEHFYPMLSFPFPKSRNVSCPRKRSVHRPTRAGGCP